MKHTLFHGTQKQNVAKLLKNGFNPTHLGAQWYQMASDFESALFHSSAKESNPTHVYVIEFQIDSNDEFWPGYPNLWPIEKMSDDSDWIAVKEHIPKECITAVYKVPYHLFQKQKSMAFKKSDTDLISESKNILSAAHETELGL